MPDQILEYKVAATEFKATGDAGQYEGHFSIFSNVDDGLDVVHPGSFEKTIRERAKRVKVFYAHDWMKLIGPAPDVLQEDTVGLFAAGRLTLDSFWGKETWALMKDGALSEGSFGYEAVKYDYENRDNLQIRHLRELKLYEISPVPLGMNPMTQIRAMKAALEKGQAGGDPLEFLTDKLQAFSTVMAGLKDGRVLSASNKEKVKTAIGAIDAAREALVTLMEAAEPEKSMNHSALLLKRLRAVELALAL